MKVLQHSVHFWSGFIVVVSNQVVRISMHQLNILFRKNPPSYDFPPETLLYQKLQRILLRLVSERLVSPTPLIARGSRACGLTSNGKLTALAKRADNNLIASYLKVLRLSIWQLEITILYETGHDQVDLHPRQTG